MKVPVSHGIYFWFMNSMMAFGTGFVIAYMFSPFITIPLGIEDDARRLEVNFYISLCFLFFYQFIIPSFFWGKRRGEFEYSFLIWLSVVKQNKVSPSAFSRGYAVS